MPFEEGEIPEGAKPFKKGESGNPNGRPKGSRNLSTILAEMLDEEISVTDEKGEKVKKKFADIIVRKLIKKANDGDIRAIQEIFDRTEGKSKQTVENKVDFKSSIPAIEWIKPKEPNDSSQ